MVEGLSLNGLSLFGTKIRKTELTNDLNGLRMAILATANLLEGVSLNCDSSSAQDIGYILVKWMTHSFFCSVVVIKHRKQGI